MRSEFGHFTVDYISGVMSLRKPQRESLSVLEQIMKAVKPVKGMELQAALDTVKGLYPTCTDFERDFMSLAFALATGVGKTRLMGAFVAYLYTQYDIRHFFIVAPGTTVYDKLQRDFKDTSSPKYVFRGLSCFADPPRIIAGDEYRDLSGTLGGDEVTIYIFNVDKFNKEDAKMRAFHEVLGAAFYETLAALDDLVLIMDESHHYRAERGMAALNDLKPLLGLELTATPLVTKGSKQIPFKNVVMEYPLSRAIEDGYTRTPYAVTRTDIDFFNFGEAELDKLMINDGIICHERAKARLAAFAANNDKRIVKPFMLIVCKDTEHAQTVEAYVKSDAFRNGQYRDKVITVHSKQKGAESEVNTKLLLGVERDDNPVEIVIHVNMLKEGWDVNNLYTIVPLRTATSKILREQMVGRGLRLPYGERTGDKDIDAVMLTAHDKFADILQEAQSGESIFKAGNVIKVEELGVEQVSHSQLALEFDEDKELDEAYKQTGLSKSVENDRLLTSVKTKIRQKVARHLQDTGKKDISADEKKALTAEVVAETAADADLGEIYRENAEPLNSWLTATTQAVYEVSTKKFIDIPRIMVTEEGEPVMRFEPFSADLTVFCHKPIANDLLIQSLTDLGDREQIKSTAIDFDGYNPRRVILTELRKRAEIDYERDAELLKSLITDVCQHYQVAYGENGLNNIVMMYKRDIAELLYKQLMQHFVREEGLITEAVVSVNDVNREPSYTAMEETGIFDSYTENLTSVVFTGIKRGVFDRAKFDSQPELKLARLLEQDQAVEKWLRPAPTEFELLYDHGRRYEPDFVVETPGMVYLVEVKGMNMLDDPDVLAKKDRAIRYCEVASEWAKANSHKEWRHLFIPEDKVQPQSTFEQLAAACLVQ